MKLNLKTTKISKMKAEWHPRDGFEVLKQQIKDDMMYAAFANKPISPDNALNMIWSSSLAQDYLPRSIKSGMTGTPTTKPSYTPLNFGD